MAYRLGLDVGTASIALVAVSLDEQGQPEKIIYHSDRIFEEPLDPGKKGAVGEPKKARRRKARLARKLIDRRAGRLNAIADLCRLIGIDPAAVPPDSGQEIHRLRAEAVSKPIPLPDLIRVLLRMSKRRGYAGGFRTKREDQEEGKVEGGISHLKKAMQETNPPCEYLGQYLWHRFQKGETLKLKNVGLYAERAMLKTEFDRIWEVQAKAHPVLNETRNGRSLREVFRQTVFYQRPLKSVAPMVGNCQLEPSLPRAPMAQPAMQTFRIEKQITDLRWGAGRRSTSLTTEQKNVIRDLLTEKETVKFEAIYKALKKAGCHDSMDRTFNTDRFSRQELRGDSTRAGFRALDKKTEKRNGVNPDLSGQWQTLPSGVQVSVINFLANLGSPQEVDRDGWETQYTRRDQNSGKRVPRRFDPTMVAFINKLVNSGEFDRLGKMGFDGGRAAYSVKTLNRLTEKMRGGLDEDKAIAALYGKRNLPTGEIQRRLALHAPTGNTVVDVALRELWREVNKMLDVLKEPPAEIIVELMRDMGLGVKRRQEIEAKIAKNQWVRKEAVKELTKAQEQPTSSNIHRYLLWQEQDTNCPYCGRKISLHEVVDGNATNRDHIIPKSLTRVGRQSDHLVLAHQSCNDKKVDRTPWQAWGSDPERWALIEAHAKSLKDKKKFTKARLLTLKDYEAEVLDDETIEGFTARQFHETSWIAKLSAQWLRAICLDTSVSRGALTAYLRRIWGLDTVIPQVRYEEGMPVLDTDELPVSKEEFDRYRRYWEGHDRGAAGVEMTDRRLYKRIDHRHHVIDALVTAITSRGLFQKMARNYKARAEQLQAGERVRLTLAIEPPMTDIRKQALELVRHCNLTHKPDHYPAGSLFKDTAYGVMWVESENDPNADSVQYLTQRKALAGLALKNGKSLPHDKVRDNLKSIAHTITRNAVLKAFEERIAKGLTPQQALAEPISHPDLHTPIKKVKMLQDWTADVAARIEHVSRNATADEPHYKYLAHDGYAYLELRRDADGKPEKPRPVTLRDAFHVKPAEGDVVVCFYKGCTVEDSKDGKRFIIKQMKKIADSQLILMPISEAREVEDIDASEGLRKVSGMQLYRLKHVE
jgi:CRISPR-associated endonuclease Csn1